MTEFKYNRNSLNRIAERHAAAVWDVLDESAQSQGGESEPAVREAIVDASRRRGLLFYQRDDAVKVIGDTGGSLALLGLAEISVGDTSDRRIAVRSQGAPRRER